MEFSSRIGLRSHHQDRRSPDPSHRPLLLPEAAELEVVILTMLLRAPT